MKDSITMSPGAKRARADYIKAWRKKNPDKTKEYAARYWERVAEKNKNMMEERGEIDDEKS